MSVEKATKAGAWSALDIVLRQGVSFFVSIILARLLTPEDFGLIAIVILFSNLAIALVQGGLTLALVQRQDTSRDEENAVFWVNLLAGCLFAAVIVLLGPAMAAFYGYPSLADLMWIPAAQVIVSALAAVQTAMLTRALRFDLLAAAGIMSSLLSGLAGISAALLGWGVWALAVQMLLAALINTAMIGLMSDWRPAFRVRVRAIGGLYRFGLGISASTTLEVLYSQGFALLVGKLHGAADLGLFNRAVTTQALPSTIMSQIISRVALPMFAGRKDEPEALRRGLRMSLQFANLLNLPVIAGLALLSDLVLLCLFGPQWTSAARILTIVSFAGLLMPFHILNLQLLLALGRSGEFLRIEIRKKLVGIVIIVIGSLFGIEGLAYAAAIGGIPAFLFNAAPTRRLLGYGALAQLIDNRGAAAATSFMAAVVLIARPAITSEPWLELTLLVALGALAYLGFGFIFRLAAFRDGWALIRPLLVRSGPPRSA